MNGSDAAHLTAQDKYHQLAERRHRTRQKSMMFLPPASSDLIFVVIQVSSVLPERVSLFELLEKVGDEVAERHRGFWR